MFLPFRWTVSTMQHMYVVALNVKNRRGSRVPGRTQVANSSSCTTEQGRCQIQRISPCFQWVKSTTTSSIRKVRYKQNRFYPCLDDLLIITHLSICQTPTESVSPIQPQRSRVSPLHHDPTCRFPNFRGRWISELRAKIMARQRNICGKPLSWEYLKAD